MAPFHFWLCLSPLVRRSWAESSPAECSASLSDQTGFIQGRVRVSTEPDDKVKASPSHFNMESRTYTEDDLDLAQVQVRRTTSERSWSELQQQKPPQVIHYKPAGKASKEVVRVCFILVNTLHAPYDRFGKHKRYRATWESAFPTPAELGDNFFKHNTSAAKFINEASSGKVAFSGTVVGWFNDTAHGPVSATQMFHDRNRYFLLARKAVRLEDYDIFTLVGLAAKGSVQRGWDRSNAIMDPDCEGSYFGCSVIKNVGMNFMINAGMYTKTRLEGNPYDYAGMLPSKAWAHEMIHSLGSLGHDNALNCGTSPLAGKCTQVTYANQFSIMGKSNYAQHPSCQSMEQLGWLGKDEVGEVTLDDADRTFTLAPRSVAGSGLKCLKVKLPTPVVALSAYSAYPKPLDILWIDHRQASGFDTALGWLDKSIPITSWGGVPQWTGSAQTIRNDGVLLALASTPTQHPSHSLARHHAPASFRRRRYAWAQSELLDVHADTIFRDDLGKISAAKGKFADATLLVGETLRCQPLGFEVQVLGVGSAGAQVKLRKNTKLQGCPSPKDSAPAISKKPVASRGDKQVLDKIVMAESIAENQEPITSPSKCHIVSVTVVSDKWVTEPSWTIEDPQGSMWLSGKGPEALNTQSDCAEVAGEYSFTINDAYGDGLCCEHGQGSYQVKVGDVVVASGGKFGRSETKMFKLV